MAAQVVNIVVSLDVNNTNSKIENFWDDIKTFLMSAAEEALELESGSGIVQTGTVASLVLGETKTTITANFTFNGEWTPS